MSAHSHPLPPTDPPSPLPEAALRASLRETLATRPPGPLLVFAYGALMWDRESFPHAEPPLPLVLPGHARRYCLWDHLDRGTPRRPALTLGLEPAPGESCAGLLFRLPDDEAAIWAVWRHEMPPGFYRPTWLPLPGVRGPALSFLADPRHPMYAGAPPEAEVAAVLAGAHGPQGSAAEYLHRSAAELRRHGLADPLLERLQSRLGHRAAPCPA